MNTSNFEISSEIFMNLMNFETFEKFIIENNDFDREISCTI